MPYVSYTQQKHRQLQTKLRQFSTPTLAIYSIRRIRLGDFDTRKLEWIPLGHDTEDTQEFALILPSQKIKFDAYLLARGPCNW